VTRFWFFIQDTTWLVFHPGDFFRLWDEIGKMRQ